MEFELNERRKPRSRTMASYTEIRGDDEDPESDSAQPSTSTSSVRMKRSDLDLKATDVSFDLNMDTAGTQVPQNRSASTKSERHNGKKYNNHAPSKNNVTNDQKPEVDRDTEADSRSRDLEFCIKMPIPDGPIIDLRGREVLFAIGVFFFLSVSIGLVVVLASDRLKEQQKGNKTDTVPDKVDDSPGICLTKQCMSRAADMLDMMDRSAHPCQDFYRFACGGWLNKSEIPPWESSWGVDKELQEKLHNYINNILKSDIHNKSPGSTERKMKTFYRKCLNLEEIDDAGLGPVLAVMDSMGGWGLFDDWNMPSKPGSWNFQTVLRDLHHKYFVRMFFVMFTRPDDREGGNAVQFDQSALPYPDLYDGQSNIQEKYKAYMRDTAKIFGAKKDVIEQFVNNTWQFEQELAEIHLSEYDEARGNPYDNYNRITVATLQERAPRIKWVEYMQDVFPDTQSDSHILVTNEAFFSNMSDLLERTDARTLNYYMMWRLVDDLAHDLPESIRKVHRHFKAAYTGRRSLKSRDQYCLEKTNSVFGFEVGASFAHEYFPAGNKKDLARMVQVLKTDLYHSVNATEWLDKKTKEEATKKAKSMTVHLAYPDFVLNQEEVDKYYHEFEVSDDDRFSKLVFNSYKHELHLMKQMLSGTITAESWTMPLNEANAYNNPTDNSILFPVALLLRPYYDPNVPEYVNYGGIGSIISHEMIHAYNGLGAIYDSDGTMRQWIGTNATHIFQSKMQCVVKLYSNETYDGIPVDGELTSNENIADIEGLKLAHNAYRGTRTKQEAAMPGMGLTNDQLFFLAFGQSYCKKRRKELIPAYLSTSEHLIEKLRVTGTLSQVQEFADAFNCPKHSQSNPSERCDLWGEAGDVNMSHISNDLFAIPDYMYDM